MAFLAALHAVQAARDAPIGPRPPACYVNAARVASVVVGDDADDVLDALALADDRRASGAPPKATAVLLTAETSAEASVAWSAASSRAFSTCTPAGCVLALDTRASSASDVHAAAVAHFKRCGGGGGVVLHLGDGRHLAKLVPTLLPLLGESGSFEDPSSGRAVHVANDAVVVMVLEHKAGEVARDGDSRAPDAKAALERAAAGADSAPSRREAARALRRRVDAVARFREAG